MRFIHVLFLIIGLFDVERFVHLFIFFMLSTHVLFDVRTSTNKKFKTPQSIVLILRVQKKENTDEVKRAVLSRQKHRFVGTHIS